MYLLALDQGTTSSRAMLFDRDGRPVGCEQVPLHTSYPDNGWVEQDPREIWQTLLQAAQLVLRNGPGAGQVAAIGIANQRETLIIWERASGEPIYPAIVWQDRRTADRCAVLAADASVHEQLRQRTGLLFDPYFSATKVAWMLDNVPGTRVRAEAGELAMGTVDSWLLWNLSGGRVHATDITNASRTLLFNIVTRTWDPWLLELFAVPEALLPQVLPSTGVLAESALFGERLLPVTGVAGDQQSALVGHGGLTPGVVKVTYGTGAFMMANCGDQPQRSEAGLLTTLTPAAGSGSHYALEGSIFSAGMAVQWLRDGLGIINSAAQSEELARRARPGSVYCVPAFTGLGAPWWNPDARAAVVGMTRDSGREDLVYAVLESICWQTRDLLTAFAADWDRLSELVCVDGGMADNEFFLQLLADALQRPLRRALVAETTALGAALLAGMGVGWYRAEDIPKLVRSDCIVAPQRPTAWAEERHRGWLQAVARIISEPTERPGF